MIVVRADGCEILDELRALATARSGWRSWPSGAFEDAGLRVVVDADGTVELEPLGVVLEGAGVSREVAAVASVLLDDAAEMIDPDDLGESVALIELVGDVGPVDDDVALADDVSAESSATPPCRTRWISSAARMASTWWRPVICWPATTMR